MYNFLNSLPVDKGMKWCYNNIPREVSSMAIDKKGTKQIADNRKLTIRLKKGALMLRNNPELNITEISDKIGFSSSRYFSKCFKDIYHVSPLAYRKGEEADKDEEEAVNEK